MERVNDHYNEALQYFREEQIVGIFLQGSQNYGLGYESSDVDTKLIVLPDLSDLVYNKLPISTTHVRKNNEHIDFKDLRLYISTFRKQNLNFLEILFTPYLILNPIYQEEFQKLIDNREGIAHFNIYQNVKAMVGVAMEKYHALEHEYPSKLDVLKEYAYDPKQLHHLLRIEDFLTKYLQGVPYQDCMIPSNSQFLLELKRNACNHSINVEQAREIADKSLSNIKEMAKVITKEKYDKNDESIENLLNTVQYNIVYRKVYNDVLEDKICQGG